MQSASTDSIDLDIHVRPNADQRKDSNLCTDPLPLPLPKTSYASTHASTLTGFGGLDHIDHEQSADSGSKEELDGEDDPCNDDKGPGSEQSDSEQSSSNQAKRKRGYNHANPFSKLLWCWLDPLFCRGLRNQLEQEDLYDPPRKARAEILSMQFERYWESSQRSGRTPSLMGILMKILWFKLLLHFVLSALKLALQISQAILVGLISEYFVLLQPSDQDTVNAYLYALGLFIIVLLSAFVHNHGFLQAQEIGMLSRIICTSAMYKKILKLDQKSLANFTYGKILNLTSNDVRKLDFAFLYGPYIVLAPLHLFTVILLLCFYTDLGPYCLIGMVLFIVWIPLQWGLSKMYAVLRLRASNYTDVRIKIMNDIITGMKVIKMFAWEKAFEKVISETRRNEIKNILLSALLRACNDGFYLVSIAWFNLLAFSLFAFASENGTLTANIVFTSIALVTGLRLSTTVYMVESILGLQDARISINRIQEFLMLEVHPLNEALEVEGTDGKADAEDTIRPRARKTGFVLPTSPGSVRFTIPSSPSPQPPLFPKKGEVLLSVNGISASWDNSTSGLKNISFDLKRGQVISIIGPVGGGKSSLLQAILGELPLSEGSVEVKGSMACTSQDPWVFGGTMRDNILFGEAYDEEWFNTVSEACCLSEDIQNLVYGDLTLVGERGVSLSGGQRARVNLARSVYKKSDIYLLDDPLSAVDPAIEHHIFDQCISDLLENSAVILVTHQLPVAHMTDHIVVMHKGKAIAQGTFDDILAIADEDCDTPIGKDLHEVFREFIDEHESESDDESDVFVEDDQHPSFPDLQSLKMDPFRRPRPTQLHSGRKPKLLKRVTDIALMREPSLRLSSSKLPNFRAEFSQPLPKLLTRTSTLSSRPAMKAYQRRSTVAGFTQMNLQEIQTRIELKDLKAGPLATLASTRQDYTADEDSHDYSFFAGSVSTHLTRTFSVLHHKPTHFANTPRTPGTPMRKKSTATFLANQFPERVEEEDENDELTSGSSSASCADQTGKEEEEEKEKKKEEEAGRLEDRGHGRITMRTYYNYFLHGSGYVLGLVVILLFVVSQGTLILGDWWLTSWAKANTTCNVNGTSPDYDSFCNLDVSQRIGVYAGLVISTTILSFARAILFFYICIRAAKKLHNVTFSAVLRMPLRFFDINPIGRILNRFSKDIGFLDDVLPTAFYDYLTIMFHFLGIMIFASVANYLVIIPMVLLIAVFLAMRLYYLKSSQELKRLEAVVRSPLYSHISNTLLGLSTIHTLKKQAMFEEWFNTYQNENTKGWSAYIISTRWFGLRVDAFSAVFIAIVAFLAIPLATLEDLTWLNRSLIGLSLVYCISLSGVFQYGVRLSTEVESLMVSAERLMAYSKFPTEPPLHTTSQSLKKPLNSWPDKGCIRMEGLNFKYSEDGPNVLKEVSCQIEEGEKVGIVGRSGAGKSSVLSALFRVAEPEGLLEIDDVQVTDIGLHDLRTKISIIPQEPILFSGTLRFNLDPLERHKDEELWNALEKVQLKKDVLGMMSGLNSDVGEAGSNFSNGQRQLACLARAILRKSKVLVIDEATANVDMATDRIIQEAIRSEFADCTVLTVAHRLHTVMDSDRILVLDFGKVREFDEPHILLQNSLSLLSFMVTQVGESERKKLKQIAQEAHKRRKNALKRNVVTHRAASAVKFKN